MKALKSHELNFYDKYLIDPEKIKKRKSLIIHSIPIAVLIAVLAGIIINQMTTKAALEAEIEEQRFMLDDPYQQEEYEKALLLSDECAVLDNEIAGMEMFSHIKETYPIIGMDDILMILDCTLEGIHVKSIGFDPVDGTIKLEADAEEVTYIPKYIDELKKTGLLVSADYSGYDGNVKKEFNADEGFYDYRISVQMMVNAPETDYDFYAENSYSSSDDSESYDN